jgi:hypothetical protein
VPDVAFGFNRRCRAKFVNGAADEVRGKDPLGLLIAHRLRSSRNGDAGISLVVRVPMQNAFLRAT